ncbi:DNA (cytosine-5-)-methyltransferase [Aeribacillus composti]|uniref:DNA (cytosine-5-)-methyltransferase n=1 Tax=Aeribacillus composti TaxID=1868734 RepID=UPI00406A4A6E
MTRYAIRPDELSNTLSTVLKDNLLIEIHGIEESVVFDEYKPKEDDNLTQTHEFKYVSLFSGVGGFEQALNKLGGTCVMASEIDKWANIAYETLYGHKTVGDITKVKAEDVPNHDLLVAGFPCQAFSVAGKRLGFEDTRGTLFFEVARIASEKQPNALLLENVKGLVSHDKGKTLNTIIQTLCDIGYTVDFNVLNSKYFGVPQNRERIFIIAIRDDLITPEPWKIEGINVVAKAKRRIAQLDGVKTFNFDWPPQTEVTTRLRDILEDNVDERFYLSEEKTAKLVAQLESKAPNEVRATALQNGNMQGRRIKENDEPSFTVSATDRHGVCISEPHPVILGLVDGINGHEQRKRVYSVNGLCPTPSGLGQGGNTEPKIAEPQMIGHIDLKGHDAIKRVYSAEGISPTLTTMGGGHREPKIAVEQFTKGDGISCCIDANYTKGTAPGDVGKGRRTHVVEEVRPVLTPDRENKRQNGRRFKENDEESFTLTAQDRHGVAVGTPPRYRIRKLTPRECFRLQGFPDSEFDKLVAAGISNSQLYKMAGNAVTVNVVEAIGSRLLPLVQTHANERPHRQPIQYQQKRTALD